MEILDTWVENGFINIEQREAIAKLIADENDRAYDSGYDAGYGSANNYDDGKIVDCKRASDIFCENFNCLFLLVS